MTLPEIVSSFKSYLEFKSASKITRKNYASDLNHFFGWFVLFLKSQGYQATDVINEAIFRKISADLLDQYKSYLVTNHVPDATINRRFSTLRKFSEFCLSQKLIEKDFTELLINLPKKSSSAKPVKNELINFEQILAKFARKLVTEKNSQLTVKNYVTDVKNFLIWLSRVTGNNTKDSLEKVSPLLLAEYQDRLLRIARLSPRSVNRKISSLRRFFTFSLEQGYLAKNPFERQTVKTSKNRLNLGIFNFLSHPKPSFGVPKRIFAPQDLSQKGWSRPKKLLFNLRFSRPKWYFDYNETPLANYFHWAILIIFCTGIGFGLYQQAFSQPALEQKLAASLPSLPVSPPLYLSFQGKLTNTAGEPIVTETMFAFAIYNSQTDNGSASLWSETKSITPDQEGIFNTLLGDTTAVPGSLFKESSNLWLGITVDDNPEMSERIQIATVGYAFNSQYLQGYPVGTSTNNDATATAGAEINTIPVVNAYGNLIIAAASPTIRSTSGIFKLQGKALFLTTDATESGSISLSPGGTGGVNIFSGATTNYAVSASSSALSSGSLYFGGVSNANTGYKLLQLATGSTWIDRFTVDALGSTFMGGNLQTYGSATISGSLKVGGSNFVVNSSGTVTGGAWNGTQISTQYGGTGQTWSSVVQGSLPYFSATGTMATLSPGTAGYILQTNGTGANPTWVDISSSGGPWTLVGTNLYPDSTTYNVGIGTTSPTTLLDISKTETRTNADYDSYSIVKETQIIKPSASGSTTQYIGHFIDQSIDENNTQPIYGSIGLYLSSLLQGSGSFQDAEGITGTVANMVSNATVKGVWGNVSNWNTVSSYAYGIQGSVDNWSNVSGTGNITLARAGRFRLQNAAQDTAAGAANITTGQVLYANLTNEGVAAAAGTIGNAAGFYYDLTNAAYGTITNSYGIYLNTPSNTGTITNHYGIYLNDQTVSGTTNNFAIYSAGGTNYFGGSVGIGKTAPGSKLHVTDTQTATASAMIENLANVSGSPMGLMVKIGADGTSPGADDKFISFMKGDATIIGNIRGTGSDSVDYNTAGIDFAEYFTKVDGVDFEEGDVVAIDKENQIVNKTDIAYDPKLLGVISAHPGFSGGTEGPNKALVALVGQVLTKISPTSSEITTGDILTSSTEFGKAVKAEKAGITFGKALENWQPNSGKDKIMVLINLSWYDPDVYLSSTGEIEIVSADSQYNGLLASNQEIRDTKYVIRNLGKVVERIGVFSEGIIANLQTGLLTAKNVLTENLLVSNRIVSPLIEGAEINADTLTVKDKFISPLVESDQITSESLFAQLIDADTLEAETATIASLTSDEIRAGKIFADEIVGASMAANYITNITNVYQESEATPSGIIDNIDEIIAQIEKQGLDLGPYVDIATLSAQLAFVQGDLKVLGRSSLADTSVAGLFTQDATFVVSEGRQIDVLGDDLYLQKMGLGGVNISDGKVTIDKNGNVNILGNLSVLGNLSTLGNLEVASGSATVKEFKIIRDVQADNAPEEIIANSSVGTGKITAGHTLVVIKTPFAKENSLIYLTPVGSTENKVIFLAKIEPEVGFTVSIDNFVDKDIKFNWWVVN